MKNIVALLTTIIISIIFVLSGCSTPCPDTGSVAPDFTLETTDGNTVSLQDFQGEIIIMNFWATWCGPCAMEMPHLQEVYDERSGEGVVLLSIDIGESKSKVQDFITQGGFTFPVLLDTQAKVAELYCLPQVLPQTLFVDTDGTIEAKKVGAFRNKDEIYSLLDSL
jgi:cytochrome c biogenesis protein CcmG/thiol:disulfide interchange protein DsbE